MSDWSHSLLGGTQERTDRTHVEGSTTCLNWTRCGANQPPAVCEPRAQGVRSGLQPDIRGGGSHGGEGRDPRADRQLRLRGDH